MSSTGKYGQQRRKKADSKASRWIVVGLLALWAFLVFTWGAGRVAAAFEYHEALGAPAFHAFGYPQYWPWKLLTWGKALEYPAIKRIVDQT